MKIAARYKGEFPVTLDPNLGPYFDEHGAPRANLLIKPGDMVMVEEQEILGESYKYDPRGIADVLFLGYGHVVLPEHAELSDAELSVIGYQFHMPRTDFEAMTPQAAESEVQ